MHILMIAPEPFFEPRGTPFSEFHRIRALADLGHTVDLVTYPFGQDVALPGLRVFRSARPPLVRRVRIGPSLAKLPLDLALAAAVWRRVMAERYDVVHSHEEGSAIGLLAARWLRVPHLYDMHSSLPQQFTNFDFTRSRLVTWAFSRLERTVIRRSRVVIVICPQLEETVRAIDPSAKTVLIENAPGSGEVAAPGDGVAGRQRLGLGPETPVVLYTGTFEAYQGLPLLLAAARLVHEQAPAARFVLVGGKPDQVAQVRAEAQAAGIGEVVFFTGERPADEIPSWLDAADVLVSPRSTGTNTPLKIYQYLRSGKPIVATRLLTHTQVLTDDVAVLTEATPAGLAAGIVGLLTHRERAHRLGEAARRLADTKYSYEAYLERTRQSYAHLAGTGATPSVQGAGR